MASGIECQDIMNRTYDSIIKIKNDEIERLRAEISNRNARAIEGDKAKAAFDEVFEENERLRAERNELKTALKEAREMVEYWAAYASQYFQAKYGLARDLRKIDVAIREEGE